MARVATRGTVVQLHKGSPVETAISGLVQATLDRHLGGQTAPATPAPAPADWRDAWFTFVCPDVSDETAAKITAAGAWPAFTAFFRLLWQRRRQAEKGGREEQEAACAAGILNGEGIKGLARSIGMTPAAMNRQLLELHRIGIVAVAKPPSWADKDAKGRFIRRPTHKGLVPASKITFNAGDDHRRPANRAGHNTPLRVVGGQGRQTTLKAAKGRGSQGRQATLKDGTVRGAIRTSPISPLHISPSAGGHADGIGRPAETHRPPAAAGDAPPLRPWTGPDEEARRAMLRRQEAAKAAREAEDAAWRQAREAEEHRAAQDATAAAERLAAAVADLPPASRQKAKRVAKRMAEADQHADADAVALQALIDETNGRAEDDAKAAKAVFKENAKAAFRRSKGARRETAAAGS